MVSPKGGSAVQKLAHFIRPTLGLADSYPRKTLNLSTLKTHNLKSELQWLEEPNSAMDFLG